MKGDYSSYDRERMLFLKEKEQENWKYGERWLMIQLG